jgi:NAD(P)-dependent dehydrogenase (short-subunit alcohol dehydrogenase family)
VVTGASRGIGAAIARAFAREGARVALVARGHDALRKLADELGQASFSVPCDVTSESSVRDMSELVESTLGGAPDIVVNNAGVFRVARLEAMPAELFTNVVNTNLVGPFLVVRAFVHQLRVRGSGHFVTIGSIADRSIFPENGAYAPAKYALRAMHEVLREELKGSGVRATLISPGSVRTAMWDGITFNGDDRTPPRRDTMLSTNDVAAAYDRHH